MPGNRRAGCCFLCVLMSSSSYRSAAGQGLWALNVQNLFCPEVRYSFDLQFQSSFCWMKVRARGGKWTKGVVVFTLCTLVHLSTHPVCCAWWNDVLTLTLKEQNWMHCSLTLAPLAHFIIRCLSCQRWRVMGKHPHTSAGVLGRSFPFPY